MSRPLLILIDGRSGSGKTSLARGLAKRLVSVFGPSVSPGDPALSISEFALEDVYQGWNGLMAGVAIFRDALNTLAAGRTAHWRAWDWVASRPGTEHSTEPADLLIAEGVGASAASAHPGFETLLIRLVAPPDFRKSRALARDGDTFRPHWERWAREEDGFLATTPSNNSPAQSTTATLTIHTDHPAWNSAGSAMESLDETTFRTVMLWLSTRRPAVNIPQMEYILPTYIQPAYIQPDRRVFSTEADPVAVARIADRQQTDLAHPDRQHANSADADSTLAESTQADLLARSLLWLDSSNADAPETRNRRSIFYLDSPGAQSVQFVRQPRPDQAGRDQAVPDQTVPEWSKLTAPGYEYSLPIRAFDWLDAHWHSTASGDGDQEGTPGSTGELGWVGQFNYEVHSRAAEQPHGLEHLAPEHRADHAGGTVIGRLVRADRAIVIDHANHATTFLTRRGESTDWIEAYESALGAPTSPEPTSVQTTNPASSITQATGLASTSTHATSAQATSAQMTPTSGEGSAGVSGVVVPQGLQGAPQFSALDTRESYLAKVSAAQAEIAEGNSYEVCLTTELRAARAAEAPLELYLRLRAANASAFGAYFRLGEWAMLSTSPERFVQVSPGGVVRAEPIKGTRRRAAQREEDAAVVAELRASAKDRAENLMIVDLLRNDLSRYAQPGSVRVERLFSVESYPSVHQMVSTIVAQLRAGASRARAIEAAFPPGSMTGAPKAATMRILAGLERRERGPYSGFLGYFSDDGAADLSVVIRTLVLDGPEMTLAVGGAITSDSDPELEWDEVRAKAAGVLGALGARFP